MRGSSLKVQMFTVSYCVQWVSDGTYTNVRICTKMVSRFEGHNAPPVMEIHSMRAQSSNLGRPMTNEQLRALVPSAFAESPHARVSSRYAYIPTIDVIDGLRSAGLVPTFARQSKCRTADRADTTKHMIRFRREDAAAPVVGGIYPEVCLINSHDGSSSYQLSAGLFRLVCLNGLMVGEGHQMIRVRHTGDVVREVIDASYTVVTDAEQSAKQAGEMARIELTRDEQQVFAEAAHQLRFDGGSSPIGEAIQPERFLARRRAADNATDLFTTLNVVQENVIRGGLRGYVREAGRPVRSVTTRAVTGIDQNTALNRALFTLAERMAELKGA